MMPGLDGYEVTRLVREDARTSAMLVLLLTARVSEADRMRAFSAGADEYMRKPFRPPELRKRVAALLARAS